MSKFSSKQRFLTVMSLAIPVAIFFAARSVASWRPRLIGVHPGAHTFLKGANKLLLSPNEKRLIVWADSNQNGCEWNLDTGETRQVQGYKGVYSEDGRWLVTRSETDKLFVYSPTKLEWQRDITVTTKEHYVRMSLASPHSLTVSTNRWVRVWDLRTGKKIEQHPAPANWQRIYEDDYVTPPLPPSGKRLKWTIHEFKGFDVVDARTQQKLWSHSTAPADSGVNFCYPHFEDGGKTLVTLEQDSIIGRDSQTGQILFSHKNKLPSPLKDWAFTKDQKVVYLLDAKGEVFRQRLR